jgi:hypothetical protein
VRVHVSEAGNRHCFSDRNPSTGASHDLRGFAGQRFAGIRRQFDRDRRFDHDRRFRRGFFFGPDLDFGVYDYACSYGYPYYTAYGCYPRSYY